MKVARRSFLGVLVGVLLLATFLVLHTQAASQQATLPVLTVTLAKGPLVSNGTYRYAITLSGFPANTSIPVECYDSVSPNGFFHFTITTNGNGNGFEQNKCYSGDGPDHWVVADGWLASNHVQWWNGSNPQPRAVTLTRGPIYIGDAFRYQITLSGFPANTSIPVECYDSVSPSGFSHFTMTTDANGNGFEQNKCYSGDGPDHWVVAGGVTSNHVQWGGESDPQPALPEVILTKGPIYSGNAYRYAISVSGFPADTTLSVECYDSVSPNGFFHFTMSTDDSGKASTQNECYSGNGPYHWVIVEGVESSHVQWGGGSDPQPPTSSPTPTATPTATPTPTPTTPPSHPVDAYSNYGSANTGYPICRGNLNNSLSMPSGTVSQTFTVSAGVASLNSALVQIDPDSTVTAHMSLAVNGNVVTTADAVAAGDTQFSFGPVSVSEGDVITLSISFTATYGKIISVYTAGSPGGTFTTSDSCPDGASNVSTTSTGLRAKVSGMS